MLACTTLARKLNPNFGVLVEAGQACWAYARHEEDDVRYADRLREAEQLLKDGASGGDEFAQLTLARFYRLNFAALDACTVYPRSLMKTGDLRRRLRDSYVFGEAVVHLWYQEYPSEMLRPFLTDAKIFLESALSAGYNIARIAIALAFVTALLDTPREGEAVLAEMFGDSTVNPWEGAINMVAGASAAGPLKRGLALGIDQSQVWQSLGTYARRLLKKNDLAEQFYRRALALNERNAVALTNLARVLIDRDAFVEARRTLDKAKTFSDRRFFWWKTVLDDLNSREGLSTASQSSSASGSVAVLEVSLCTLPEITQRFERLLSEPDYHRRGYLLEELFIELARLNFGCVVPGYRLKRAGGSHPQIDAYFEHRGAGFRVECKWQAERVEGNQVTIFSDKLDVANLHGLFLSMSGFKASAIEKAKEVSRSHPILLMDGNEADLILSGRIRLDAAISKKLSHLMCRSEPYWPVNAEQFG